MGSTKINFGDKIFLYGHYMDMDKWYEWGVDNPAYNAVMGYTANGGYFITPKKTKSVGACLPGFVMDFLQGASLTVAAPFSNLVDVTDLLSLQSPYPAGTRIWMPSQDTKKDTP